MLDKESALEELLNRQILRADTPIMRAFLSGQSVMVAGAGGTIGAALCQQIIRQQPQTLVLYEYSEPALFAITRQLRQILSAQKRLACLKIVPVLASISDGSRLADVLQQYNVDIIFHAAAYKHVGLLEKNVMAGIQNNILGTRVLGTVACEQGVKNLVFVSTDKASQPDNIMGVTKRLAEQCLLTLGTAPVATRFSIVRFGNVLESSGSVMPLFRQQILAGGPVTVTHPEITREFLTAAEAAQLTIHAGAMTREKAVYSFNLSEPVRVVDLARKLIRQMGYSECSACAENACDCEKGIRIRYIGLRDGESLGTGITWASPVKGVTSHPNIFTLAEPVLNADMMSVFLKKLQEACGKQDEGSARKVLDHALCLLGIRMPNATLVDGNPAQFAV